ncbi:MAG: hypothetical protein IIV62_02875, partial [Anaerotignum sp.]|nr:hypothetical protein [Anaerotignum sp.]
MRKKKWILLALIPLFLTGCWDKKDPEDRVFIISLGVDDGEAGYVFSFAPADIETGEAEVYQAESSTLAGATAVVDTRTSRKTELGQLKTIIFSDDILRKREKLDQLLQELERSQTVSEKVMLLATTDTAADCVNAVLEEDGKTGLFLWDFYKNTAEEVAVTKGMDLDTFLTEQAEQNGNGVLPRISVKEEKLELGGGIAVSANGVYPLSNEEERGYLFLLGEAKGALLEEGDIPLEIGKTDVRYDFSIRDDRILCQIRLPMEGTLQGGEGMFLSAGKQEEIRSLFENKIKEEVL